MYTSDNTVILPDISHVVITSVKDHGPNGYILEVAFRAPKIDRLNGSQSSFLSPRLLKYPSAWGFPVTVSLSRSQMEILKDLLGVTFSWECWRKELKNTQYLSSPANVIRFAVLPTYV